MKAILLKVSGLAITTVATSFGLSLSAIANTACDSYYYTGRAATGQPIHVDLCSVYGNGRNRVSFSYYLGRQPIDAQANCAARTWIVYPERIVYRPQSRATARMLGAVCNQNQDQNGYFR